MNHSEEMTAEGQVLDEEQIIDDLVHIADNLKRQGKDKPAIFATLVQNKNKPQEITEQRWKYLCKNAMEYL